MKKFLARAAFVVVLLFAIFAITAYVALTRSVAPTSGLIRATDLSTDVKITYDAKGLPQVWAKDAPDALYALGWLHAADRLFQMELTRRVARGQLSELLGSITLKMDIEARRIGHTRLAQKQIAGLSAKNRKLLDAYAAGVNAYVKQAGAMPFEFYLLHKDFEPWKAVDCLTILSFQTWYSESLLNNDTFFNKLIEQIGTKKARDLMLDYPAWAPYSVPQKQASASRLQKSIADWLFSDGGLPFALTNSSNSWVVAPDKSKSGKALLASDPHLEITRLPQFWYFAAIHISDDSTDAMGITTPGIPLIVMGKNKKAAWAFTAGGVDISEYYREKINPENPDQYLTETGWATFDSIPEPIRIAGQDKPYPLVVRVSRHGPLMTQNDSLHSALCVDWAGFDADLNQAFTLGFKLLKVDNFHNFRRYVTSFGALDANWTYADIKGNIGYQLGTPLPIRPQNSNRAPLPGWTQARIWRGYHPLDETPHSLNPKPGWLATANNKQVAPNDLFDIPGNFRVGRILRLNELLKSQDKFDLHDFARMQFDRTDDYLLRWKSYVIPVMQKANMPDSLVQLIQNWQGETGLDSWPTLFISEFIQHLKVNVFEDEIGPLAGKVRSIWLEEMLDKGSAWFDDSRTAQKETQREIVDNTLHEVLKLTKGKRWADFQTLTMAHPMAVVPGLNNLLPLHFGPWPWPGTISTLNASFPIYKDDHFKVFVGPSWRFLVDFARPNEARLVLPAGISGNPMSPHFMDLFDQWKDGIYWPVSLDKKTVFDNAASVLVMGPHKPNQR